MVMGSIATGTDVLVIGGGPGGYTAAARAAALGKDVTLVEVSELGGTCLQVGCIPSKALISAGETLQRAKEAADFGITMEGLKVDMAKVQAWKQKVVQRLTQGVAGMMKAGQVNVVKGRAHFVADRKVAVEGPEGAQLFEFKHCIIATGSYPSALPVLPFDHQHILDNADTLALAEVPEELVVVGGGYIGVELGTAFRKLGARVTIVEALDTVLAGTDPDLLAVLLRRLRRLEIAVHLKAELGAFSPGSGKKKPSLAIKADGKDLALAADKVLVSVGRRPSTRDLGLEYTGVELDERGFIKVDGQGRTAAGNIFAVGDVCNRGPMLAHKAYKEAIVAAEAIAGRPSACDWVTVPAVMFTDPEIAYCGLSETQARTKGYEVKVAKFSFSANGRALTLNESDGLVKVVADAKTGVVLGVHMAGPEVSELIGGAALALEMGATVEDIAATIYPHPTLSESLMEAAGTLLRGTLD